MLRRFGDFRRQCLCATLIASTGFGCGGGASETPPPSVPATEAPAAEPSADTSKESPSASTPAESSATSNAPPPSDAAPTDASEPPRDIRYVQTPEGLRVEILGVKFFPKAEALKTPAGIGVRLTLEATASEARSLLAPEHGPLAFAGAIKRKGKPEPETFGDDRKGEGELSIDPAKPTKIVREWPGKKGGGLGNGDVLELDVGLWGLGTNAADRRPVKQFLRVKVVVENWKGRARIEPPPSMKGKE